MQIQTFLSFFLFFYLCGSVDELLNEKTWCILSYTLKKKKKKMKKLIKIQILFSQLDVS